MITDIRRSIDLMEQLINPVQPTRSFDFLRYLTEDEAGGQPSDDELHNLFKHEDIPLPPDKTTGPGSVPTNQDGSQPSNDDIRKSYNFNPPDTSSIYSGPEPRPDVPASPDTTAPGGPPAPPTPPQPPRAPTAPKPQDDGDSYHI